MNLCDAVRNGGCITVPEFQGHLKIRPINSSGNCIALGLDGTNPSKTGWQPSAIVSLS